MKKQVVLLSFVLSVLVSCQDKEDIAPSVSLSEQMQSYVQDLGLEIQNEQASWSVIVDDDLVIQLTKRADQIAREMRYEAAGAAIDWEMLDQYLIDASSSGRETCTNEWHLAEVSNGYTCVGVHSNCTPDGEWQYDVTCYKNPS